MRYVSNTYFCMKSYSVCLRGLYQYLHAVHALYIAMYCWLVRLCTQREARYAGDGDANCNAASSVSTQAAIELRKRSHMHMLA